MSDDDYKLSPEAQAAVDAIVARGDKCAGCGDTEFTHWVQPDGNFCIDCVVARSYEVPALRGIVRDLIAADPVTYFPQGGVWACVLCDGSIGRANKDALVHSEKCPLRRAKELRLRV